MKMLPVIGMLAALASQANAAIFDDEKLITIDSPTLSDITSYDYEVASDFGDSGNAISSSAVKDDTNNFALMIAGVVGIFLIRKKSGRKEK